MKILFLVLCLQIISPPKQTVWNQLHQKMLDIEPKIAELSMNEFQQYFTQHMNQGSVLPPSGLSNMQLSHFMSTYFDEESPKQRSGVTKTEKETMYKLLENWMDKMSFTTQVSGKMAIMQSAMDKTIPKKFLFNELETYDFKKKGISENYLRTIGMLMAVLQEKAKKLNQLCQTNAENEIDGEKAFVERYDRFLGEEYRIYIKINRFVLDQVQLNGLKKIDCGNYIYYLYNDYDYPLFFAQVRSQLDIEHSSFPFKFALTPDKKRIHTMLIPFEKQSGLLINTYELNGQQQYGTNMYYGVDADVPFSMDLLMKTLAMGREYNMQPAFDLGVPAFYVDSKLSVTYEPGEREFYKKVLGDKKTVFVPFPPKHERNQLLLEYLKEYVVDISLEEMIKNKNEAAKAQRVIEVVEEEQMHETKTTEQVQNDGEVSEQTVEQKPEPILQEFTDIVPVGFTLPTDEASLVNIGANAASARKAVSELLGQEVTNKEILEYYQKLSEQVKVEQEKYSQAVAQGEDLHKAPKVKKTQQSKATAATAKPDAVKLEHVSLDAITAPIKHDALFRLISQVVPSVDLSKPKRTHGDHLIFDAKKGSIVITKRAEYGPNLARTILKDWATGFNKELCFKK